MKKIIDFLFKRNAFKDVLEAAFIIPGFAVGFFGAEMCKSNPHPSFSICLTIALVSFVWTVWAFIYFKCKM